MTPNRIDGYDLLERIGVGAVSNIYRARDVETSQIVAIKDVVVNEREDHKYLRHVRNEYNILTELWDGVPEANGSPGYVRPYKFIKSGWLRRDKRHALAMEYVEGKDLRVENRYPLGQFIDFFRQIAETLSRIHARGIVHGDLKPENIIVGPTGKTTLVDFGFSCPTGSRATSVRGTREYMAPEQVNKGLITELTDLYNFGATMYYLLTGQHVPALVAAPDENGHFISGANMRPQSMRDLNPQIPARLERLVMDCCAQEAVRRCSSARVAAELLKNSLKDFSV